MNTKLMIHAGIHRTGTTALQRVLFENRQDLLGQGIAYPFNQRNHQELAWSLFEGRLGGQGLLHKLKAECRPGVRWLVLSGEDFCIHEDLAWLSVLSEHFDCHATFYLRRQDDWVMSWYNQHVRWPFDAVKSRMSPEEFLLTIDDYHWLDFEALLDRWVGVLGREKIRVGVIERGGITDAAHDFIGSIGADLTASGGAEKNESIPAAALEIMRHLDFHQWTPGQRSALLRAIRVATLPTLPRGRAIYPPSIRNLIINRFKRSNEAVARRYLGRQDGVLFREATCSGSEPHQRFHLPSSDQLLAKHIAPLIKYLATEASANSGGK